MIIEDLEVYTGLLREEMGVIPGKSGEMIGNIVFQLKNRDDEWITTDCRKIAEPTSISTLFMKEGKYAISDIGAKFILIVEKAGIITKLVDTKFDKKYDCILLSTRGQPDRASRFLVKKLHKEYNIPIYILVDGDPWGHHIASVWKFGSKRLAFESERLACPDAQLVGIFPSDIERYKIKKTEILSVKDVKRATKLLEEPWFDDEPEWKQEIKMFLELKRKCEIENLSEHDVTYLGDYYLPEKLRLK